MMAHWIVKWSPDSPDLSTLRFLFLEFAERESIFDKDYRFKPHERMHCAEIDGNADLSH